MNKTGSTWGRGITEKVVWCMVRECASKAKIENLAPHDLRRTVATRLGESLGVGGEQLIKKVLGHADGSVTAIYNRYGYVKEMRAGLDAWARELTK